MTSSEEPNGKITTYMIVEDDITPVYDEKGNKCEMSFEGDIVTDVRKPTIKSEDCLLLKKVDRF